MAALKTVAITGAGGFLGTAVREAARTRGLRIVTFGRRDSDDVPLDLAVPVDEARIARGLEGADALVHLAAHVHRPVESAAERARFERVNHDGTRALARAAHRAGVPRLVYASTIGVYAFTDRPAREDDAKEPENAYGASKARGEDACAEEHPPSTLARLATLYGPGDRGNVARLARVLRRGLPVLPIDGTKAKSLLHVADAADVLLRLADAGAVGAINVAGAPLSLEKVCSALSPAGRSPPLLVPPSALVAALAPLGGFERVRALRRALANLSRATVVDTARLRATFSDLSLRDPFDGLRDEAVP